MSSQQYATPYERDSNMTAVQLLEKHEKTRRLIGASSCRLLAAGYQDRLRGEPPCCADDFYFRGYCDRILEEITEATPLGRADRS